MTGHRLVFIGVGAVGGAIAGLVSQVGIPFAMVARGQHGQAIRDSGLQLRLFDQSLLVSADCFPRVSDVDWRANDIAIVATKLNDAMAVMDDIVTHSGHDIPIVCATNGVVAEDWAMSRFGNVISMLVWLPATHLNPGQVMLHSEVPRGVLDVGVLQGDSNIAQQLAGVLSKAGFDSRVQENILAWKRAKWITNLGGAAQAMISDNWLPALEAAQAEGERVAFASGLEWISKESLLDRCNNVRVTKTIGFERGGGSTWQSRQRGKPLESPFIEGAMASLGEKLGVPVPVNRFLSDASQSQRSVVLKDVPGF